MADTKKRKRAEKEYEDLPVLNRNEVIPFAQETIKTFIMNEEAKKNALEIPKRLRKQKKILMKTLTTANTDILTNIRVGDDTWNVEIKETHKKKRWDKEDLIKAWSQAFGIGLEECNALYALEHESFKDSSHSIEISKGDPKRLMNADEF